MTQKELDKIRYSDDYKKWASMFAEAGLDLPIKDDKGKYYGSGGFIELIKE